MSKATRKPTTRARNSRAVLDLRPARDLCGSYRVDITKEGLSVVYLQKPPRPDVILGSDHFDALVRFLVANNDAEKGQFSADAI